MVNVLDKMLHGSSPSQHVASESKLKSCVPCRTVKARCETPSGDSTCDRCTRRGQVCERPAPKPTGRPKGSRKCVRHQTALQRALQTIQKELAAGGGHLGTMHETVQGQVQGSGSVCAETGPHGPEVADRTAGGASSSRQHANAQTEDPTTRRDVGDTIPGISPGLTQYLMEEPRAIEISPHSLGSHQTRQTDADADDDGGLANPVRLLAEAAEEEQDHQSQFHTLRTETALQPEALPPEYTLPPTLHAMLNEGTVDSHISGIDFDTEYLAQGLESLLTNTDRRSLTIDDKLFFKPARQEVRRDLGSEYDPIALALVTPKEVTVFFATFYLKLHPMLPVLDPALHTPDFVQTRSAFLLTAICAQGASLTPGAEEATKRLRIHAQRLSELISRRNFASVEIVQAFLLWISWLPSSQPFQEERLWHETKYAINMAVELEVGQPLDSQGAGDRSVMACLLGVDINAPGMLDRVIRNRQRLWVHLFLWDSSLSLAFGKATRFTQDTLIRNETWCFHQLATEHDRVTTACVVLRRRLVSLTDHLRSEILLKPNNGSEWVSGKIDETLGPWHTYWTQQCGWSPYLELMYRHTRLWSLSYALQTMSSRGGEVQTLMNECFAAALSSCEFVCAQLKASRSLWGFNNIIGPMLSFEALLAVRLFPMTVERSFASRARLLGLLSHLSLLLENVGTSPPHRLGTAAVYGRHLQVYLRRRVVALCLSHHQQEAGRYTGGGSMLTTILPQGESPLGQGEALFNQLFSGSRVSPTDQVQSTMTLNWDGADALSFLDTTSGWTEDFFRTAGAQQ